MKLADAPPPGWYPDPERTTGLRWWAGTDWASERRVVATPSEKLAAAQRALEPTLRPTPDGGARGHRGPNPRDTERIVSQVRDAARQEVDRAANLFSRQARDLIGRGQSMVAGYVGAILRWIRIAVVVGATLVVIWFVLQFVAQAAFFNWLGDRIDNVIGE